MELNQIHELYLSCSAISTDTRNIETGAMFFALKGPSFNGNKYALNAIDKGAKFAIVDEVSVPLNDKIIQVDDVLTTLQDLARFHREYLGLPIIALTGSNGKTTTKELINKILQQRYKTIATNGNLNNHIGVPLTLLRMTIDTEIGIVEMGANHAKEIELLCNIAKPNVGYITNFGKAHLEGFGSEHGIILAKSELYDYLKSSKGLIVINLDDLKQVKQVGEYSNTFSFSESKQASINIILLESQPCLNVSLIDTVIKTHLVGVYNFHNIAAALAVGCYFKLTTKQLKIGIEDYVSANNRSQIVKKNSNQILLDAYNANPSSMGVALENFKRIQNSNKIAILGDMFELGATSAKEHLEIINQAILTKGCIFYFIGSHFFEQKTSHSNFLFFETFEDLKSHLKEMAISNTSILIKGSRGMALERVLELL